MRHFMLFAAAILCLPALLSAQTILPLNNGGFETDLIADGFFIGVPAGWTQVMPPAFGASSQVFCEDAVPADYILDAPEGENYCSLDADAGIFQTVTASILPGHSYVFSYLCGNVPGAAGNHRVVVKMRIGSVEVLSEVRRSPVANDAWTLHVVTYTHPFTSLPAGSLTVEISLANGVIPGGISIDDLKLVDVVGYTGFRGHEAPVTSFECEATNSFVPTANFDCDTVRAFNVTNHAVVRTTATTSFPSNGQKYLELSNALTGPGGIAPNSAVDLGFYAATSSIGFDWKMMTTETIPSGSNFFDTASYQLFDFATGTPVQIASGSIATTNDSSGIFWNNNNPNYASGVGSNTYGRETSLFSTFIGIPPSSIGHACILRITIDNNGDNDFASSILIDNLQFGDGAQRPGTQDGLLLATGVDSNCAPACVHIGELSGGSMNDTKTLSPGDVLHIGLNTFSSSYWFKPILLAAHPFTTGSAGPAPTPAFGLWVNVGAFLVVDGSQFNPLGASATLNPGGNVYSFPVPSGLAGNSMLLQLVVPNTLAPNGVIGTSEAHLLRFI